MTTLHIEHSVTDFDLWLTAFGRFEPGPGAGRGPGPARVPPAG